VRLTVGSRVRGRDSAPGSVEGTVTKVLGRARVGGGVHLRVAWDNGSSGVHRPDTVETVA